MSDYGVHTMMGSKIGVRTIVGSNTHGYNRQWIHKEFECWFVSGSIIFLIEASHKFNSANYFGVIRKYHVISS